jgi:acetylornithine deacetylase/succinyl-diaminopimelate desuccinylase-like protein
MTEDTARIAQDLIRLDTTNYGAGRSNGETPAAEYLGDLLEKLGLTTTYVDAAEQRTSVITRVAGSDPSLPALVVHGHTDVVPADPQNWTVDPFGGEIRDGMLWGRGAVDMKNMDAMMIGALTDILGAGKQPRRDLVIAFFSDEENGGVFGSQYVVANHPELFEGATEAISEVGGYSVMLNGTRAYLLQTGEKALIWIKLIARGTAAHGSRVIHANAVTRLAEAVVALGRRDWPVHLTSTTEELIAELARIMEVDVNQVGPEEIVLSTGTAAGFIQASLRTTTNPTVLTAGYKHNVIPDVAEALIDIRCLAGEEESVLAEVRELIGPHVELEIVHQDIGLENKFEGALVEAMVGALQTADPGAPVLPYLLSGGTDNKALSKLGITGYGFAPLQLPAELDFPALFHGVDERVPLEALVFGRRVLGDLLTNY